MCCISEEGSLAGDEDAATLDNPDALGNVVVVIAGDDLHDAVRGWRSIQCVALRAEDNDKSTTKMTERLTGRMLGWRPSMSCGEHLAADV